MRVTYQQKQPYLKINHCTFDTLSKLALVNQFSDSTVTFNLEKASYGDGNLSAVLAAVGYTLKSRNNKLDLGPRKFGYNRVRVEEDLFGYRCSTFEFSGLTKWSGATPVCIIKADNQLMLNDYLIHSLIRQDWKSRISVKTTQKIKCFMKRLYLNVVQHAGSDSPMFVSASFKQGVLKFTVTDCGQGFLRKINAVDDEVVTDKQAIRWAMNGQSVKGHRHHKGTLRELGNYCKGNGGYLHVVSGDCSVEFESKGKYSVARLDVPFRGTIINFAIRVKPIKFCE